MSAPSISRLFKVALLTLLVVFVALFVFAVSGTILIQLAGLLLFGWSGFLWRVIPQITFNREIAFDALLALGLALFGLHRILRWWAQRDGGTAAGWRFAWTLRISAMVLLLFATSIAAVGIVHQIAWLCRERQLIVMTGMSQEVREMSNLRQVVTAAQLYAADHEGRFPAEIGELIPDYSTDHHLLFTRARAGEPPQPILYRAGYKVGDPAQTIVAASPRPFESSRGRRRAVAHLDSSVAIIDEGQFQELMRQQGPPK